MIKARHHTVIYPLFQNLTRWLMSRNFSDVKLIGDVPKEGSVLVLANHISWWDGFWMMYLNLHKLKRKFHFMMLEEQLKKHWYFRYTGAYSVKKHSREALESINYTLGILAEDGNMVFVFPQGKIHSMHQHEIHFEQGVKRIVKKAEDKVQVLFVANFVDYLSEAKPQLYIYTEYYSVRVVDEEIEKCYQQFYKRCLESQKQLQS